MLLSNSNTKPSRYEFSSESVTEGHPDKVADIISDSILDAALRADRNARVACECMVTSRAVFVSGEISGDLDLEIESIVREAVLELGYDSLLKGLDGSECKIMTCIDEQSPDISAGVSRAGAGDQGMMYGYARAPCPYAGCNNNSKTYLALPQVLARNITDGLTECRTNNILDVYPDGKALVTIEYRAGRPYRIAGVTVAIHHPSEWSASCLKNAIIEEVILPNVPSELMDDETRIVVNGTGRFIVGGPMADCGLTGRKIIADTYGGVARHGGGAFSGKDPSKVDRSGAYMARYIALAMVRCGLAKECESRLSYTIGRTEPDSIELEYIPSDKQTGCIQRTIPNSDWPDLIRDTVRATFDTSPCAIVDKFGLKRPIYANTARRGHFGRPGLPWESTALLGRDCKVLMDHINDLVGA